MSRRAVLFDLDGTLLDSLKDIADSTNTVLKKWGFAAHPVAAYRNFVGDGKDTLARRVIPESSRDETTIAGLLADMKAEYAQHWADTTRPYDGIAELLDALTAKGISLNILSNKPHHFSQLMVSQMLGSWHFEVIVGARPDTPKKPNPSTALKIAKKLAIPPEDFLFLGDSDIDIKTATAAGMFPVGALWGFRTREELLASGAKALIKQPGELLKLL